MKSNDAGNEITPGGEAKIEHMDAKKPHFWLYLKDFK
jgi:hypothetical protein